MEHVSHEFFSQVEQKENIFLCSTARQVTFLLTFVCPNKNVSEEAFRACAISRFSEGHSRMSMCSTAIPERFINTYE